MAQTHSRHVNGIKARAFAHHTNFDLIQYASAPVINDFSDFSHPCQGLVDLSTIYEKKERLEGLKLAYVGDGNNVAHSLIEECSKVGMNIVLACPKGYEHDPRVVAKGREIAKRNGSEVGLIESPKEADRKADVIYAEMG